jgi:hypothetical protein
MRSTPSKLYRANATGEATLFPVVRERLDGGAVCGIKSGYWASRNVIGLKLAGYWPGNRAFSGPTTRAACCPQMRRRDSCSPSWTAM